MKNKKKTTACLLLAVLLITAGITYNPISACAGAYKKSVSKKITIDPNKYNYMILEVKEEAEITITVKASDGKSDSFSFVHTAPGCCWWGTDENADEAHAYTWGGESRGKKKAVLKKVRLTGGSGHAVDFAVSDDGKTAGKKQKLKVTVKADKPVLRISQFERVKN